MTTASSTQDVVRHVLWTGGWDSSFRILQLLFESNDSVAPVYFVNPLRRSLRHEIRAMDTISVRARARSPELETRLRPTTFIELARIPERPEVSEALRRSRTGGFLGPQYDYIARYVRWAPAHGPLELCLERDCRPHVVMRDLLEETTPHVYRVREAHRETDVGVVFGGMHFPVLDWSKGEMGDQASRGGYRDILEKAWFCHYPVGDAACGRCSPCEQVMKAGMAYRLPRRARVRHALSVQRRLREWRREHEPETAS